MVNVSDIQGGAARATFRLHSSLVLEGIDSYMLVDNKTSDDYRIIGPPSILDKIIIRIRHSLDRLIVKFYKNRDAHIFSPSWSPFSRIIQRINEINPDIVHLHWICASMIRIEDFQKIKYPIIWTLHDNWPFTGGCHVKWECENYLIECNMCPRLKGDKMHDLSYRVFSRKKRIFPNTEMTIVSPSKWLGQMASKSALLKNKRIVIIPNPINTNTFRPVDRIFSKKLWGLDNGKKIILFGAINPLSDYNKGLDFLIKALEIIDMDNIELAIIGASRPKSSHPFKFNTHYFGKLNDDISLVTLYNAADVTVVPSLQENFCNTILESMACGTPTAAFDVGGNSDLIDHQKNGYLASPKDSRDLAKGIEQIIQADNPASFRESARKKITSSYSSNLIAKKYLHLYESVLQSSKVKLNSAVSTDNYSQGTL